MTVVHADSALRLKALLDFSTEDKTDFIAGDEWLFEGPGTYLPRKEVEVIETIRAVVIKPNQAIKLRARKETIVCSFVLIFTDLCVFSFLRVCYLSMK